jgi:hypothetical protein
MYIAEAIPTVGITFFVLTDRPDQAKFLTAEERRWLVTTIAAERRATEAVRKFGSSPSGYPAEPLVSYQINRQLSGWNLPPPMIRAFGAHCQYATLHVWFEMKAAAN